MTHVLTQAWTTGVMTKSNMARTHANVIAEAVSRGWLTTEAAPGVFGNLWLITSRGLTILDMERRRSNET